MINSLIQASYPQALAKLISSLKTIEYAEEYLQIAVEQALIHWPQNQPDNPTAWLVKVALNKYIDFYRRQKRQVSLKYVTEQEITPDLNEEALLLSYNDDLLRLIFTCCHPALNQETQIILALKHVLGLNVYQIASALIINKSTLEQRLIRAKKKITANKINYETPPPEKWSVRLNGVLKTIYLLFNEGYLSSDNGAPIKSDMCKEAIRLARLLCICVKNDPEVLGLLALMLQQDARSPARFDKNGEFILLSEQNRSLWRQVHIQEANILVEKALKLGKGTPYAIQAAIATLHNNAQSTQETDWKQIFQLYQLLIQLDSNPVIQLNAAIAQFQTGSYEEAIQSVIKLTPHLKNYRHFYTTLAGLYYENNQLSLALTYYRKASTITRSDSEKQFIKSRISSCNTRIK
ncbi:RNA polymerase sigma factor [Aliikangiella sp. IMCC44359]|uniref:RNA polymerase sigma factor n=1 Tax=Aliikangiella sp. IMCC44359 TaxID=3459125 RepID=UPI00403AE5B3